MTKLQELREFAKSYGVTLYFEANFCFKIMHVIARNESMDKTLHMDFNMDAIKDPNGAKEFETSVRDMVMDISGVPRSYGMKSTVMVTDEWVAKVNEEFNDTLMQIKKDILEEE